MWTDEFGAVGWVLDEIRGISIDAIGDVYVAGTSGPDALVRKYNSNGDVLWSRQLGGGLFADYAQDVALTSNGELLVAGYTFGSFLDQNYLGSTDAFFLKMDAFIPMDLRDVVLLLQLLVGIMPDGPISQTGKKYILAGVVMAFLIGAFAVPKIPFASIVVPKRAGEIVLLVDVSGSMGAKKSAAAPNRLERVKPILNDIVNRMEEFGDVRISLHAFTSIARSHVPFVGKEDYPYLRESIRRVLGIHSIPGEGSSLGMKDFISENLRFATAGEDPGEVKDHRSVAPWFLLGALPLWVLFARRYLS